MQFIANGPVIPDALLQAHEEGRVVFFCGAGISYPAGLPSFKGLVEEIYRLNNTSRTAIEQEAFERSQFDATLDLLERRLPGQRLAVRRALAQALKPKLRRKGATDTHAALLSLAHSRDGARRLVTTNFDRVFDVAAKRTGQPFQTFAAPMLPIPKNSRWNGLVYLHGLLDDKADETTLNRLVVTSGDFGLAYLTERWAARFVSELFRNYGVCFVGYSINDPVLRYMMDALAADRMLGERTPQAWALGDCETGQEDHKTIEWEAKGVTPILYEVPAGRDDHSALHKTLHAWAETYRDGVMGRERIVVSHALTRPSSSTRQDDFVGRMLWALSHESGLPAKLFAEFDPVPSLDWLEALAVDRYVQGDLARFGVPPRSEMNRKLTFSLICRPAPYTLAPWMALVSGGAVDSQLDDVMFQLARWLVRHLNDPALIIWVSQKGGQLHDRWVWLIELELDRFVRLNREGKVSELEEIRANAPNAIPGPLMQTLWRFLLTGRVKVPWRDLDLYRWKERLNRDGLTTTLRLELRDLLTPKVTLKKPFRWEEESDAKAQEPERLKQLVDWELELAADNVYSSLNDLRASASWQSALPVLIDDFQQLVRDALELSRELGAADDRHDAAYWYLPSITPHWQNRGFHDWVALIEMLRDAWLVCYQNDPRRARQIAQSWLAQPFPTFRRLALFSATRDGIAPDGEWVSWLLSDDGWWLWSVETQREVMRLLVLQGAHLPTSARSQLEAGILAGPPREMFVDDIEPDRWQQMVDDAVWLRLAKLASVGSPLGADAQAKLTALSEANPEWKLAVNEHDEFSHWMSGTGDPDYEERREVDLAPRKRRDLVIWLQRPPSPHPISEDNWRETCRERFFHCVLALSDLAQLGHWPAARWREALQVWSEDELLLRSWRFVAPLVRTMPDEHLLNIAHGVSWWLKAVSKVFERHEAVFLDLCRRLLELPYEAVADNDQPVSRAINHPVGHVTQALLQFWFKRKPNDDDGLPIDLEPLFTRLCDTQSEPLRHGRVLLASRLIALFRVDRTWTETHLLPLFDWRSHAREARAVWEGFLWAPRLHRPLLVSFKAQLLDTAVHYAELGEHGRQYAAFLTFVALDPADTYTQRELQTAIGALPQEGLQESVQALVNALEGAGEQREDYWVNRVQPFWQTVWPKSRDLASPGIAKVLARLAIAARGEFPVALSAVQDWLQPFEQPDFVVHPLHKSGLCRRFPADVLRLLSKIIDNQPWAPRELGDCLQEMSQALPGLLQDSRYQRLVEYSRRRGM